MSTTKPTKQCVQRLQREYKQIMKVVEEREERRRVVLARRLQQDADCQQNPFFSDNPTPPTTTSTNANNHPHHPNKHHTDHPSSHPQETDDKAGVPTLTAPDELLFTAAPDPDNLLRWYFLFESPPQEPLYTHGKYLGEFVFPSDYPFKPPKIFLLTPNGRFATGKEICLSNSSYHPEQWSPAWSIETVLLGLISFFYSEEHTTGAIDHGGPRAQMVAEKKKKAKESKRYNVQELKLVYRRVFPDEYARDVAALEAEEAEQHKQQQQQQQQQQMNKRTHDEASHPRASTALDGRPLPSPLHPGSGAQQQEEGPHRQGHPHDVAVRRSRNPHWSTVVFLMIAVLVTLRIVIF